MTKDYLIEQANEMQRSFSYYGFLNSPLSRRKIISLFRRGFNLNEIYNFGCDVDVRQRGLREI